MVAFEDCNHFILSLLKRSNQGPPSQSYGFDSRHVQMWVEP